MEEEAAEEEDMFGEVVAATVEAAPFLEARIFLILFAYSKVKGR